MLLLLQKNFCWKNFENVNLQSNPNVNLKNGTAYKNKIYLKPYQNSFERVSFSVMFEAVGGGRETMAGHFLKIWLRDI